MKNFVERVFGGAIILAILLLITFLGRVPFIIGIGAFSFIGLYEMKEVLKKININIPLKLLFVTNTLIMIAAFADNTDLYMTTFAICLLMLLICIIFDSKYNLMDGFGASFTMLYVSFLMSHIIRIQNINYIWLLYLTAWGSDTFAYLVGSTIGKHKIDLIAHISPNKTLEGCLGGVIGAIILNIIYVSSENLDIRILDVLIFTIIAASLSQVGDLVASYIKRQTGIKDFGHIIIGHGGILDRFDSLLFIAPVLYLFSIL